MGGRRFDTLFTVFTAACAVVLTMVLIAAGGLMAKITVTPHSSHGESDRAH